MSGLYTILGCTIGVLRDNGQRREEIERVVKFILDNLDKIDSDPEAKESFMKSFAAIAEKAIS